MTVTLLAVVLAARSSTSGKVPITPDASIVWSDDFEDGDLPLTKERIAGERGLPSQRG